ncbi:MAG: PaxA [Polyangia bacterium]
MFDRYAAATAPSWGRRALIVASIMLHVSAAIALVIYSVFHVEEIAPPAVSLTFFSAPPPPPPPPPPAHKKTTVEHKIIPTNIVVPTKPTIVQPKKEDDKPPEKDDDGEEGGVEGGVKGGVKGGTVGGVVGGTIGGTGTDLNAKPAGGKMVAGFTLMASVLNAPDPHLSDQFKDEHKGSIVKGMYKVCLANDGSVSEVSTMTSIPQQDSSIIQQIKSTWKYKPQPLPVCFAKPFAFKIN